MAAAKSELLSRADGSMKERHHQTLSVASSRVSLGGLFGKSVGGILRRKSQSIDDEWHLGAPLDFFEQRTFCRKGCMHTSLLRGGERSLFKKLAGVMHEGDEPALMRITVG